MGCLQSCKGIWSIFGRLPVNDSDQTDSMMDNKEDFGTIYDKYFDRVYKYAYTILLNREDAEDIVEETFMTAFRLFDTFDPSRATVSTWITRIAHNKAVNLIRSAEYSKRSAMPEYFDIPEMSDGTVRDMEENEIILYLYSRLSQGEREYLNLRYAMDMTDAEIAELLGINVKAANKRFQRLLSKCRTILEEKGMSPSGTFSCISNGGQL